MSVVQSKKPDLEEDLKHLKDFQRRSVDAVFQRLYLDPAPARRFLIADEVGLGKTLIARGVITRAVAHLWDNVRQIDVIYLCSNNDIARQNVSRLTPRGIESVADATRITLLPITQNRKEVGKVNVIALTPGTSLDLKGSLGTKRERALLMHMLLPHWGLDFTGACRVFCGYASLQRFRSTVHNFASEESVDVELSKRFLEAIDSHCRADQANRQKTIRQRLNEVITVFNNNTRVSKETLEERAQLIGELRQILAKSCIRALQPDLIILDEFQRFKDLLTGDGPSGEMARQLFEYEDESTKARVLLLSATPYKMYTVADEAGGEDHYADFVRTVRFLLADDPAAADGLENHLKNYRRELFRLAQTGADGLETARSGIETFLRKIMVRTERMAITADRSGMLVEKPQRGVQVSAADARTYVDVQRITQALEHKDPVEYWKAAPWLVNFMVDQYELGRKITSVIDEGNQTKDFVSAIEKGRNALLPWSDVASFRKLDPAHGKLSWLIAQSLDRGLWKALWLPPSLPYYSLAKPFDEIARSSPTKSLLFSAWRVVPRVVAASLSHEAERRMYEKLEGEGADLSGAPDRHGDRLSISRKDGRTAGLSVLSILYPSVWLARECHPRKLSLRFFASHGRLPTVEELIKETENHIKPLLDQLTLNTERSTPDESWYWAAPMLFDLSDSREETAQWLNRELALLWSTKERQSAKQVDEDEETAASVSLVGTDKEHSAMDELINRVRQLKIGEIPTGAPPKDLLRMIALMAIAGPATVALRSFALATGASSISSVTARDCAARVGASFRTLFNQPDSTAIVKAVCVEAGKDDDYWKQCLEYGAAGGLQAVLDEYAHLLVDEAGVFGKSADRIIGEISQYIVTVASLKRARVGVQDIYVKRGVVRRKSETIRSRLAMRLGEVR
jgi:hypothetical protein